MQTRRECDRMIPMKGGYACCPECNAKLLRISPETEGKRLPVWCRKCKREIMIDIYRGQSFKSPSPEQSDVD